MLLYLSAMEQDLKERSRNTWDQMAPGWDRHREFMVETTRHVAQWLVDNVGAQPGDVILDLAAGPGDNGFLAAERVGPDGKVIVTDFASQMVNVARRRAEEFGLTNVETRELDAEKMDLPDDSVDGIICRWGFMLMIDPDSAMKECRRVLRDGRRMSLSVWAGPEKNPWVAIPGMTMIQMGHPPPGDPWGPGGMYSLAEPDKLRTSLQNAGFGAVTIEEMPVYWRYPSFEDAWNFMREVAGAIAAAVKELPPERVEELKNNIEANFEQFKTDEGLVLSGVTLNAVAS